MRHLTAILLLACFAATGTGAAAALHRTQHAAAHADSVHAHSHAHSAHAHGPHHHAGHGAGHSHSAGESTSHGHAAGRDVVPEPHSHETDCRVCLDLRLPGVADRPPVVVQALTLAVGPGRLADAQRRLVPMLAKLDSTGPPLA